MIRLKHILNEALVTTPDFITYIKDQEGAVKDSAGMHKAYQDSVGVWTIGYGHTGNVKPGQRWTEQQAESQLKIDLTKAETAAKNYIQNNYPGSTIDAHQLKMLTDFVFNLGGLSKFPKFTAAVVKQKWDEAVKHYKRFAGGRELRRRNQAFYNMFLKPMLSLAKKTPAKLPGAGKKQSTKLIGKTLYPLSGDPGYATIRDDNYVNNGIINNIIKQIWFPDPVGSILFAVTGKDGKLWYYVKLADGSGKGYVRSDVVKIKQPTSATKQSKIYTVKPGDSLSVIANKYKTTVDKLKQRNQLKTDTIQVGQKLKI